MNYNSLNSFSSSPQVPMPKYECSPIMNVEKYQFLRRNMIGDVLGSGMRNPGNLVDFHNQNTPAFKEPASYDRKEQNKDKMLTNPYISVIKFPLNTTNSLIGNYLMALNNHHKMENNTSGYLPHPGIVSSLKKVDSDNGVTNIYINYANTKNKNDFLKKKSIRPKFKSKKEEPKKEFKLDGVIVNGKKVDCLLPVKNDEPKSSLVKVELEYEDQTSELLVDSNSAFNSVNIIKPLYENDFRRFTNFKNRLKTVEGKCNPSPKTAKNMNSYIKDPKFISIFKNNVISYDSDYNLRHCENPKKFYLDSLKEYKSVLLHLQDDYISKTRKLVCWQLIDKAQNIIEKINELTRILIVSGREYLKIAEVKNKEPKESRAGYKTVGHKRKKINYYYQNYDCEICKRSFDTGQGLGGHMSRMHPNCSTKYREKILVRRSRVHMRKILYMAKERLLSKYGYDYEKLLGSPSSKKVVKKIISEHKSEFRNLLKEMKK